MTDTGTPASGETDTESPETPGYTSPTEQLLQSLPFGIFRNIADKLSRSGGRQGGQFEFSLQEMQELHRQFKSEADLYQEMLVKAENAGRQLDPLADDPASKSHHKVAKAHFEGALRPAIQQQLRFARGFEAAVGSAIGVRQSSEEAGASAAKKAGSGL